MPLIYWPLSKVFSITKEILETIIIVIPKSVVISVSKKKQVEEIVVHQHHLVPNRRILANIQIKQKASNLNRDTADQVLLLHRLQDLLDQDHLQNIVTIEETDIDKSQSDASHKFQSKYIMLDKN